MPQGVGCRPRFSVVILARNEAQALPKLLADLADFVDRGGDLLLVDTGSTDETVALARRSRCWVEMVNDQYHSVLTEKAAVEIEKRFARGDDGRLVEAGQRLFHFGAARQHAARLATNNFVLQLDACDELEALDTDALDRWIDAGDARAFEYDQLYGSTRLRIARFYDRRRYEWVGRVHEVPVLIAARANTLPTSTIRCDETQLLVRHNKDESKERNYLAGLALQVMERPDQPRWWHYLGRELFYQRWFESAVAVLEAHVAMTNSWPPERSQSFCFMGEALEALDRADAAKDAYRQAIALDTGRREPLLRLAALSCRLKDFDVATDAALQALTIPYSSALPEHEANYTWMPHSILYWSLFWLGRKAEARAHWETYLSLAPERRQSDDHARLFPSREGGGALRAGSRSGRTLTNNETIHPRYLGITAFDTKTVKLVDYCSATRSLLVRGNMPLYMAPDGEVYFAYHQLGTVIAHLNNLPTSATPFVMSDYTLVDVNLADNQGSGVDLAGEVAAFGQSMNDPAFAVWPPYSMTKWAPTTIFGSTVKASKDSSPPGGLVYWPVQACPAGLPSYEVYVNEAQGYRFAALIDYLHELLTSGPRRLIYFHCRSGVNRAGSVTVSYFLKCGSSLYPGPRGRSPMDLQTAYAIARSIAPRHEIPGPDDQQLVKVYCNFHHTGSPDTPSPHCAYQPPEPISL